MSDERREWMELVAELRQELAAARARFQEPAIFQRAVLDERDKLRQELAEARAFHDDLLHWLGSVVVVNFLHDYRNQCFQMQGKYDGSISAECVASCRRDQATTERLIAMAQTEAAPAAGGEP